jgi:two-component system, OmpR family, osmolarity sensor histidine kinase EnvZ
MTIRWRYFNPFFWLRKLLPRTLFARSLLIIVIPVLLLQAVLITVFVDNHWRKVSSRLAFSVAGEISIMVEELQAKYDEKRLLELAALGRDHLDLLITIEKGRTLDPYIVTSGTWEPFTAEAMSYALKRKVQRPFTISLGPDDQWVNIGVQLPYGVLRVFVLERRLFSSSAYIFIGWMLGSSAILFAIAVVFMRNQMRPIHKLAIAAERLGMGRDIPNFKPEGAREVRAAGRAFLEMYDRIRRQLEQRTLMLAGISHDLRTPLTRLKLGLSFLGEGEDVQALKGDVNDMERMINSYLDFVRSEGGEAPQRIELKSLLEKLAQGIERHGKQVTLSVQDDLVMTVRPIAFERALQNLLSNAEKYAQKIWLEAFRHEELIHIVIEDNGPGIDPALYQDVFRPFYRVDVSRNTATGGVGLGLPITQDIIHSHGGQIKLDRSSHGGLKVSLSIPV